MELELCSIAGIEIELELGSITAPVDLARTCHSSASKYSLKMELELG
jgi:hypothetical protein